MIFFVPVLDDHIARSYFYNEFSYSHGSVTLLGTSHAIFHACWVLVLFILIIANQFPRLIVIMIYHILKGKRIFKYNWWNNFLPTQFNVNISLKYYTFTQKVM